MREMISALGFNSGWAACFPCPAQSQCETVWVPPSPPGRECQPGRSAFGLEGPSAPGGFPGQKRNWQPRHSLPAAPSGVSFSVESLADLAGRSALLCGWEGKLLLLLSC